MGAFVNLTGQQFGKWTVLDRYTRDGGVTRWLCRCECKLEKLVYSSALKRGLSTGCTACGQVTHGMAGNNKKNNMSAEYTAWNSARMRCTNPTNPRYADYGGRGITMFPLWLVSFEEFYRHIGPRPIGHILDREDNDGNYEPGNVRWVTYSTSNINRRNKRKLNAPAT